MTGLYCFFYALLHFATYAVLDHSLDLAAILADVVKRPYVTVGFSAFVLLIPLAATSHNRIIRLLGGKRWKRLHRLVYLCALGGVLHYLWLVKADTLSPLFYLALFLGLMCFRIPPRTRAKLGDLLRRFVPIQRAQRLLEGER
jgi:sulfoxide reductase heme-binding subunit YedZ